MTTPQPDKKPSLLQVILSVIGAAFGVQNEETRQRDFQHGRPLVYIIAGVLFTLAFVLTLVFVVAHVTP